ncbi:MAG: dipeptidase [Phycisphaerae bacterium]|nr:dipeptidase [Phycisphaerae bacterium]
MLNADVKAWLDSHRDEHLAGLCELLRFESISNVAEPDGCRPCADWLAARLRGIGFAAEVLETAGRPCVVGEFHAGVDLPTVLIYGHYDVQPPDPLELWDTGPFEPTVRDGWLYARGADDDKGQLFMHFAAAEAWLAASGSLPVNLKILLEGEEEIGSPSIEKFLTAHAERLAADALVISDTGFFAEGQPTITSALRGLASFEVIFNGPDRDVHSGLEGGMLTNPINALARLVAALHDDDGKVTIPGFYDDVLPVGDEEKAAWRQLPFDEADHARQMGTDALGGGERGYTALERNWLRPAVDCNGIFGGYQGQGEKTIIPASAGVKITMRLVADQDPGKIVAAFEKFVAGHTPPGIKSEVKVRHTARPVLLATDSMAAGAGLDAMAEAFAVKPVFMRCGASVPITEVFQRVLGLDAVMLGVGLPEDNLHSPNEKLKLSQFYDGTVMAAAFLENFAERFKA